MPQYQTYTTQNSIQAADKILFYSDANGALKTITFEDLAADVIDASAVSGIANVKAYGAVGDGTTNDTPAVQAALAAANVLYFPPGTYYLGAPTGDFVFSLGNKSNMVFFGDGDVSILKLADNIGRGKSMFGSGNGQTLSNVYWHDLKIDLNGANNLQTSYADPLRLNSFLYCYSASITDILIENVTVVNGSGSQQIRIANDTANLGDRITIRNCRFHNFGIGVPTNLSEDTSCVYVFANNFTVEGCEFSNDAFTMIPAKGQTAIEAHVGKNFVVRNNRFIRVQLPVLVASDFADTVNGVVSDNVFQDTMYMLTFDPAGSYGVDGFVISNNQYNSVQPYSVGCIYVGNSTESTRTRTGLQISNNRAICETTTQGRPFLVLSDSEWQDLWFDSNHISNFTAEAIFFEGQASSPTASLMITNNIFDSNGSTAAGSPFFPSGNPLQIIFSPASDDPFKAIIIDNNTFANTLGKNYGTVGGHVWISGGGLLRAQTISFRNNNQPDDSYGMIVDGGAIASRWKDITSGNLFYNGVKLDYYGGVITVASTITLPNNATLFYINVTGAQDISNISAGYQGQRITLFFNYGSASNMLTGVGNLLLAGNFNWSANDTITLVYLGTQWVEVARSNNS